MNIYHLKADYFNYQGVTVKYESDITVFDEFGKSIIDIWKPIELTKDTTRYSDVKKKKRPLSDYPMLTHEEIVFSNTAFLALKDLIQDDGEFLPAYLDGELYHLFNNFNRIEFVDFEKSDVEYHHDSDIIYEIKKYFCKEELLGQKNIFILPRRYHTYVSEAFYNLVNKEKLTGFIFEKIWE